MSGYRGTIGSPKNDKVVAWIYDRIESVDIRTRNRILRLIQCINADRDQVLLIKDETFRRRIAKIIKDDAYRQIDKLVGETPALIGLADHLGSRLKNIAARNYRKAMEMNEEVEDVVQE